MQCGDTRCASSPTLRLGNNLRRARMPRYGARALVLWVLLSCTTFLFHSGCMVGPAFRVVGSRIVDLSPKSSHLFGGENENALARRQPVLLVLGATSGLSSEGSASATQPEHIENIPMSDHAILGSLYDRRGWRNVDMGAGGNCLFLSIAPQVLGGDLEPLPSRSPEWRRALGESSGLPERWEGMPLLERAHLLRRIAMLDEVEFMQKLAECCSSGQEIDPKDHWRAVELFKDMSEEFISTGHLEIGQSFSGWALAGRGNLYTTVRELASRTPREEIYSFVVKHAQQYVQTTGREGNWAGSSEMAALSNALRRPFEAYGNDWITQDAVAVKLQEDGSKDVLPYFKAPHGNVGSPDVSRPPIRVFQTNGGGHYQMLK